MENMQRLNPKIVCPIVAKEIQDFNNEQAIVQKVEVAIRARDECIKQIEVFAQSEFATI
jgi:hypothetical protein